MSENRNVQEPVASAYYIKLGRGGIWEEESIRTGKLRFGWRSVPVELLQVEDWQEVERVIRVNVEDSGAATRDFNQLQTIIESDAADIWITFAKGRMWWGRVRDQPVREDELSKYRTLVDGWHDEDTQGRLLLASDIPGSLSQKQGYRGTSCSAGDPRLVERVINGIPSPRFTDLREKKVAITNSVAQALRELHWKDFEVLVDLVFRGAGWRRVSVAGETMKFADMDLEEPITGERYLVQVKSRASRAEYQYHVENFPHDAYEAMYFVVHSPSADLREHSRASEAVQLVLPERLAELVVNAGLVDWLMDRVR